MTPVKITFSQILFEDESMPFQDCDDDLIGECSQSFLENSQFFVDLMQNFQSGGGISYAEVVDLNDAVIVLEKSRRRNKNIKLKKSTETLAPTDLIRFYIQDDHLDHPISTTIMPVSDLTIEKILTEILKVLLSKKSIQLDSGFKVEVITIRRSVGSGKLTAGGLYKGKERPLRINLWHHDNHDDVIKSVKGFFGSNYCCENCEKPYNNCESHRCPNACYICFRMSCPPGQPQRCKDCDRLCVSESCYQAHKFVTGKKKKNPFVAKIYQCRMCCKVIKGNEVAKNCIAVEQQSVRHVINTGLPQNIFVI
ncbi:DNA-directed DNA polymerase [Caerostris extrusa]|uniref:DNA-directed DNA polymerase n=1 Tax=Caerostris extrusa TaxID=172846 RepID=A0AAV4MM08_CAEEX|nr:DNA-directed DNA polymerase [Caerostris extrusa]